ncbi:MAG: Do family serine endopeptidase [Nitrospinota bacterium]
MFVDASSSLATELGRRRTPLVVAIEKVSPAVVNIYTSETGRSPRNPFRDFGNNFFDQFFNDFFSQNQINKKSLGSGVLINKEGYIITNEHVIARASEIRVALSDKREFDARVIGADIKSDLAIIKIDSDQFLPFVAMGRSDDLMIGEQVVAIGNPFGLRHTVTTGIISALDRNIRAGENKVYTDFIQVDASINPGNSGGPLLNINGSLIGINTAIYQKAEGIGFAIPIDDAKRIVDELIRFGKVRRGWLGVSVQEMNTQLSRHFQLDRKKGVLVVRVAEKSPAGIAGIKRSDIILAIEGHEVASKSEFRGRMASYTVDDNVRFSILRDGKVKEVMVRVISIPKKFIAAFSRDWLGLQVQQNTPQFARTNRLGTSKGMVVINVVPKSPSDRIGITPGDVIRQVNQDPIDTEEDYNKSIADLNNPDRILMLVQRGRQGYYVTLEP